MNRILIVKTSSLGDIVHNFPAITDLKRNYPETAIDWIVEENYSDLPLLHPGITKVIPVSIRRWRRESNLANTFREVSRFFSELQKETYNAVIDTQGLFKSALISKFAKGPSYGLNSQSAREPVGFFYTRSFKVRRDEHAVEKNRKLIALAMNYNLKEKADYGLQISISQKFELDINTGPYAVLLPFSSNKKKSWSDEHWITIGKFINQLGMHSLFIVGTDSDYRDAQNLSAQIENSVIFPISPLDKVTLVLGNASVIIGLDTGLTHLAAALCKPTIGIYLTTNPDKTGLYGPAKIVNIIQSEEPPVLTKILSSIENFTQLKP